VARRPRFDVWPTPIGQEDLNRLRGRAKTRWGQVEQELQRQGCKAAGYRLQGDGVDSLCCVHLTDDWRLITSFPATGDVCVVLVGQHVLSAGARRSDNPDALSSLDVYASLYHGLGLTNWPDGDPEHGQPCCEDAMDPPLDADAAERFKAVSSSVGLDRNRRREARRKRQRGS
jgi:hypothetical protein